MSIYQCQNCKKYFSEDELGERSIDMENYYGLSSDFSGHHYKNIAFCPYCKGLDLYELNEEEIIEELNKDK